MSDHQKSYVGRRLIDGTAAVYVIDRDGDSNFLPMHLELCNHSPTGPEWGYAGSGPAQLAFAILFDALGDREIALDLHQRFKFQRIGRLDRRRPWRMTEADVIKWAANELGDADGPK